MFEAPGPPSRRYRRATLLSWGAAAAGTFAITTAPARAAEFEYKAAHVQSVETPLHVRQVQLWEQVAKETNGRLIVHVFPNSELGGQPALLQQLRVGAIQFLTIGNDAYSGVVPVSGIDAVGFAFKNATAPWAVTNGRLGDYVRKEFEAKGLYIPGKAIFDLGMCHLTSSLKPIRNADDLAGFKLRVPPSNLVVDLFRTLGASPVPLSAPELYPGLQSHLVDGQSNPYSAIAAAKLWEVQKYLSMTDHQWVGSWYAMNGEAWKALPPDIQSIVDRNAAKYSRLEHGDANARALATKDKLARLGMVFNKADTETMRVRLGPYYARAKAQFGPTLWGLLEESSGKLG